MDLDLAINRAASTICNIKDDVLAESGLSTELPSNDEIVNAVASIETQQFTFSCWEESTFETLKAICSERSTNCSEQLKIFAEAAIQHLKKSTQYCHIWNS